MNAEFDRCTAYGLKAGTHPEETSEAPEATSYGGAMVSIYGFYGPEKNSIHVYFQQRLELHGKCTDIFFLKLEKAAQGKRCPMRSTVSAYAPIVVDDV